MQTGVINLSDIKMLTNIDGDVDDFKLKNFIIPAAERTIIGKIDRSVEALPYFKGEELYPIAVAMLVDAFYSNPGALTSFEKYENKYYLGMLRDMKMGCRAWKLENLINQ